MNRIFDGHLDIAMNALRYERDQRLPVDDIREREVNLHESEPGTCTTTVEQMRRSGVVACVTTVIARTRPSVTPERLSPRYGLDHPTQDMAFASAMGQLAYYEALEQQGFVTIISDQRALTKHWQASASGDLSRPLGIIITMEGADPIMEPADVHIWHRHGLRSLMLAHFQQSCYAYGTPSRNQKDSGPLTDKGRALLSEMASLQMPLDLTHLCDESFYEAYDLFGGPVYASHSNCRVFADHQRQLTDEQIRMIHARDGVIGAVLYNHMITQPRNKELKSEDVPLSLLVQHIDHICQLVGDAKHVAIGSDLDGGFGREDCLMEIDTVADLHLIGPLLMERGFSDADVCGILGENWLHFWERNLPES